MPIHQAKRLRDSLKTAKPYLSSVRAKKLVGRHIKALNLLLPDVEARDNAFLALLVKLEPPGVKSSSASRTSPTGAPLRLSAPPIPAVPLPVRTVPPPASGLNFPSLPPKTKLSVDSVSAPEDEIVGLVESVASSSRAVPTAKSTSLNQHRARRAASPPPKLAAMPATLTKAGRLPTKPKAAQPLRDLTEELLDEDDKDLAALGFIALQPRAPKLAPSPPAAPSSGSAGRIQIGTQLPLPPPEVGGGAASRTASASLRGPSQTPDEMISARSTAGEIEEARSTTIGAYS